MEVLIPTFLAFSLVLLMIKDYKKGVIISFLVNTFFVPGTVDIIGGIRFKFVILAVALMLFLFKQELWKEQKANKKILIPVAFYFLYSVFLALFASIIPFNIQIIFLIKMMIYYFAFGFILWHILASSKIVLIFEKYLGTTLLIITILGIVEYILSSNLFSILFNREILFFDDARLGFYGRICSAAEHPLDWGQSCVILLGFSVLIFNHFDIKKYLLICFLIIINCVLTVSRSCYLPLFFFIALFFIIRFKYFLQKHFLILLSIFVGFLVYASTGLKEFNMFQDFFMSWNEKTVKGSSVELREMQLEGTLAFVGKDNFYCGTGYGMVANSVRDSDDDFFENANGLESIVFSTIIEQGFIGLICFFVFYYMLFHILNKKTIDSRRKWLLFSLFVAYLLSLIMTGNRRTLPLFYSMMIVYIRHEEFIESTILYKLWKRKQEL